MRLIKAIFIYLHLSIIYRHPLALLAHGSMALEARQRRRGAPLHVAPQALGAEPHPAGRRGGLLPLARRAPPARHRQPAAPAARRHNLQRRPTPLWPSCGTQTAGAHGHRGPRSEPRELQLAHLLRLQVDGGHHTAAGKLRV